MCALCVATSARSTTPTTRRRRPPATGQLRKVDFPFGGLSAPRPSESAFPKYRSYPRRRRAASRPIAMILGIVSDTHGHLTVTRAAIEILEDFQVDHVIHCGDIGSRRWWTCLLAGPPILSLEMSTWTRITCGPRSQTRANTVTIDLPISSGKAAGLPCCTVTIQSASAVRSLLAVTT